MMQSNTNMSVSTPNAQVSKLQTA